MHVRQTILSPPIVGSKPRSSELIPNTTPPSQVSTFQGCCSASNLCRTWWPSCVVSTQVVLRPSPKSRSCMPNSESSMTPLHQLPCWPLGKIQSDLCGPLPTATDGSKHLQVLIDAASQYTASVPLKTKGQAAQTLIDVLKRWQLVTGRPAVRVHTENARELMSVPVQVFHRSNGTVHTSTTPRSSHQIAVAERAIRDIVDDTRTALLHGHLPPKRFQYAAMDATIKRNSIPSTTTDRVPHEDMYGTNPELDTSTLSARGAMSPTPLSTSPSLPLAPFSDGT